MTNIMRLRRRLPLIVFILLVLLALMLLGFACACLTDQPMQAVERALGVLLTGENVVDVWAAQLLALAATTLLVARVGVFAERASPALLQRFRF